VCVREQVDEFDEFCDLIGNTHTLAQGDEEQEKAHSIPATKCPNTAQREAKERVAQWLLELAVTVLKEISQRIQQELVMRRYDGSFYRRLSEYGAEELLQPLCTHARALSESTEKLLEPICSRVCSEADKLAEGVAKDVAEDVAKDVANDVAKDVAKDVARQRSAQTKTTSSQCDKQMSAKALDNFFVDRVLKVRLWRDAHLGLFAALQRRAQIIMGEVSSCSSFARTVWCYYCY
jgi:hypothetical protein